MGISYNTTTVRSGLVLHLDAANPKSYTGSGTTWKDLSGQGNNSILVNGVGYTTSNNGSMVFDGANDYATISRPSSIVTGGSLTVCVMAKWTTVGTSVSNIQALVDNNHSAAPMQGFILQDRPDLNKALTFSVRPSSSGTVISTFQVGDGKWHYIVGTNDGAMSKLYIDGVFNAQYAEAGLASVQPVVSIGYWQFAPGRYLTGNIPLVQLYNRALTAQEVRQNFEAVRGRYSI
jgi:hypothetical protein